MVALVSSVSPPQSWLPVSQKIQVTSTIPPLGDLKHKQPTHTLTHSPLGRACVLLHPVVMEPQGFFLKKKPFVNKIILKMLTGGDF